MGYIYFAIIYIVAEILAIPAIPLTASAGYLFGTLKGTGVVLCSASVAAAVSFLIGRTFLRSYVESLVEDNPRFSAIDRAIGKEVRPGTGNALFSFRHFNTNSSLRSSTVPPHPHPHRASK